MVALSFVMMTDLIVQSQPSMERDDCGGCEDVGADSPLNELVVMDIADTLMKESTAMYEDNHLEQEKSGSSFPEAIHGCEVTLVGREVPLPKLNLSPPILTKICQLAWKLNSRTLSPALKLVSV